MRLLTVFLAVIVAACGGGGSSGGGGGGAPASPFAGSYSGTQTVTLSSPLVSSTSLDMGIVATVQSSGAMTIADSDGFTFDGNMNGSSLTASGTFNVPIPELGGSCEISTNYSGNGAGNTLSGSLSGEAACTVPGATVNFDITGTFTLERGASASLSKARLGGEWGSILNTSVRQGNGRD